MKFNHYTSLFVICSIQNKNLNAINFIISQFEKKYNHRHIMINYQWYMKLFQSPILKNLMSKWR